MRHFICPIPVSRSASDLPAWAEQPPAALMNRWVANSVPSSASAITRTQVYSSILTRVSSSVLPLPLPNSKIPAIGEGLRSMTRYSLFGRVSPSLGVMRTDNGTTAASAARAGISRRMRPATPSSLIGRSPNRSARTLRQICVSELALSSAATGVPVPANRARTSTMPREPELFSVQKTGIRSVFDICTVLPGRFLCFLVVAQCGPALARNRNCLGHGLRFDKIIVCVFLCEAIDCTRTLVQQFEFPAFMVAHAIKHELHALDRWEIVGDGRPCSSQ